MTDNMIELGRRAVACKGWRWMPGMLVRCGDWLPVRMVSVDAARAALLSENAIPDLTDPATLGCLLALVREAWGDDWISTGRMAYLDGSSVWVVTMTFGQRLGTRQAETEAGALVAALEAAP
jgi:hypothetical protein